MLATFQIVSTIWYAEAPTMTKTAFPHGINRTASNITNGKYCSTVCILGHVLYRK